MRILPILFNTDMVRAILEERKSATRRVIKYTVNDVYKAACFGGRWAEGMNPDNPPQSVVEWYCKEFKRPPCKPGDILYVRETWYKSNFGYEYRATYDDLELKGWFPSIHMPKEAARIFHRVKSVRAEKLQESFFAPISPIFELLAEGMDIGNDCRDCIETYGNPCCVDTFDEDGSNLYGGDCGILDEVRGEYSDLWNRLYAKPMPVREHGKVVRYESYPWEDIRETKTYRGLPWLVIGNPWVWVIEFERTGKPDRWPEEAEK